MYAYHLPPLLFHTHTYTHIRLPTTVAIHNDYNTLIHINLNYEPDDDEGLTRKQTPHFKYFFHCFSFDPIEHPTNCE